MPGQDNLPSTIGLEIEGIALTRKMVADMLGPSEDARSSPIKMVTRDASVESETKWITPNVRLFMGNRFVRNGLRNKYTSDILGYEVVTHPLERKAMEQTVINTISLLSRKGEIYSPRASIHVHTGFPRGLIFLKGAVTLGLKAEALLFKLAGMGREYRGSINHSAFARPLASPPAIMTDRGNYLLLDPEGAVDESTTGDFWNKFGIIYGETGRYVPLRYFGLNVYSTLLRGTMEYRYFNYTSNTVYINACVQLCQLLSEIMIKVPLNSIRAMPHLSVFSSNPDNDYVEFLRQLYKLASNYDCEFEVEPLYKDALIDIIENTPQPVFHPVAVRTHLADYRLRESDWDCLKVIKDAVNPGTINVHNFGQRDRHLV